MLPFNFRESLRHRGMEPKASPDHLPKATRSKLDKQLLAYLQEGGLPEAQGLDVRNRVELLRGYVDTVMLRDVIERHAVSQPLVLRWMVRQLLGNAGSPFSVNKSSPSTISTITKGATISRKYGSVADSIPMCTV